VITQDEEIVRKASWFWLSTDFTLPFITIEEALTMTQGPAGQRKHVSWSVHVLPWETHQPSRKWYNDVPDPRKVASGHGRRACPGRNIADQGLYVMVTTILHALHIIRATDDQGQEIIPDVRTNIGLLSHALPFPYQLGVRKDAQELVKMCAEAATTSD
jgi:hypothetical protein